MKKEFFYGERDQTLEKVAQGGYEVSITGDFHNFADTILSNMLQLTLLCRG